MRLVSRSSTKCFLFPKESHYPLPLSNKTFRIVTVEETEVGAERQKRHGHGG